MPLTFFEGTEKKVEIAAAMADYEQKGFPAAASLDGKKDTGWAVDGSDAKRRDGSTRRIIFKLARPLDLGKSGKLRVTLRHEGNGRARP